MRKLTHPHLAALVFNTPLMIHRPKLHQIIRVLGPKIGADYFDEDEDDDVDDTNKPDEEGLSAEGICCISVYGTLTKRAVGLSAMSGLTSYESLSAQVMDAATNPACKAILMDFDSYGGGVDGCLDLADLIYQARLTLPVYGIANCHAYSAGYALASACEKLWVTQDGGVGSIGVIAEHCDESTYNEKIGLKYTAVTFGSHKNDFSSNSPLSEGALAELQASVDYFGDMFVALVSRNRGLDSKAVLATQAACFDAQPALAAGLVDAIGTRADVMDELKARVGLRKLVPMPGGGMASTGLSISRNVTSLAPITLIAPSIAGHVAGAIDWGSISLASLTNTVFNGNNTISVPPAPASVDAISKEGISMLEPTPADAKQGTPPDADAIRLQATNDGKKEATAQFAARQASINALCQIAGAKGLAADFIASELTVADVQKALVERRVKADAAEAPELQTEFLPQGEPGKGQMNNPNRLMDAVKRRLAARNGKREAK